MPEGKCGKQIGHFLQNNAYTTLFKSYALFYLLTMDGWTADLTHTAIIYLEQSVPVRTVPEFIVEEAGGIMREAVLAANYFVKASSLFCIAGPDNVKMYDQNIPCGAFKSTAKSIKKSVKVNMPFNSCNFLCREFVMP